jgi:sulfur carrier protein
VSESSRGTGGESQPLLVNGRPAPLPAGRTLAEVLDGAGLANRPVAVEVDGEVVPRSRFSEPCLNGGERIEIVTFVGGG